MKNIWKSAILGVVAGDALGCPVQFESRDEVVRHPVTGMRGYGTFNLPAGSWTDDSSLTLALLESIARVGGIDETDIMNNFVRWLEDGAFTPYGYAYDIGGGTMDAIRRYEREHDPRTAGGRHASNNGNGSLMRIMPAVLEGLSDRLASVCYLYMHCSDGSAPSAWNEARIGYALRLLRYMSRSPSGGQ